MQTSVATQGKLISYQPLGFVQQVMKQTQIYFHNT